MAVSAYAPVVNPPERAIARITLPKEETALVFAYDDQRRVVGMEIMLGNVAMESYEVTYSPGAVAVTMHHTYSDDQTQEEFVLNGSGTAEISRHRVYEEGTWSEWENGGLAEVFGERSAHLLSRTEEDGYIVDFQYFYNQSGRIDRVVTVDSDANSWTYEFIYQ